MASASLPGICGWGNLYYLSLLVAHGSSPSHGGGLWAPLFSAAKGLQSAERYCWFTPKC
jgi:hypothetical protein